MDFSREVAAGVAFLDKIRKDDWREAITSDPDRLEMVSPTNCVLGIVVGEFWGATRVYAGADPESATYFSDMHEWAADHGFVVRDVDLLPDDDDDDDDDRGHEDAWDDLADAWRAELGI